MYSGGFYPFPTQEEFWAWWSRHIYVNRYVKAPKPVYEELLALVGEKDYFVLTTNVDHCFQKAGFDKTRLFYTQGDYGLLQSVDPVVPKTYDNEEIVREMVVAQGFRIGEDGALIPPAPDTLKIEIPRELIPVCPDDGGPMTTNLRVDDRFVQDANSRHSSSSSTEPCHEYGSEKLVPYSFVSAPVVIKYPFWQMTALNEKAVYACLNYGEAMAPRQIAERSICIDGDIGEVLEKLRDRTAGPDMTRPEVSI